MLYINKEVGLNMTDFILVALFVMVSFSIFFYIGKSIDRYNQTYLGSP